jgi:hypothetical protein
VTYVKSTTASTNTTRSNQATEQTSDGTGPESNSLTPLACNIGTALQNCPTSLDTAILGRMVHNGRILREELRCGNIKPELIDTTWHIVEMGLLASRYLTVFAESLSMTSFFTESVSQDEFLENKIIDINKLREEFVVDYTSGNITPATHPIMRDYHKCHSNDPNSSLEVARVAATCQLHQGITQRCGGDAKTGSGCRFGFPKKKNEIHRCRGNASQCRTGRSTSNTSTNQRVCCKCQQVISSILTG